jgi:hypothetical protein
MKRKLQHYEPINISKKQKISDYINLVTPTETKNYINKDYIIDYFIEEKKNNKFIDNNNDTIDKKDNLFITYICNKGVEFEKYIINHINKNIINVESVPPYINDTNIKICLELMKKGVPIIHSVPFLDLKNKTKGVIDLIVRNDYVSKLIKESPPVENKGSKFGDYHYVVIDIKYTTIELKKDKIHVVNTSKFRCYKTQLNIYNDSIGDIQNFTPRYSYLLGLKYKNNSEIFSSFDKLGTVDFKIVDKFITDETRKSIEWVRNVKNNFYKMILTPPSIPELYPNMNIDSGKWNCKKEEISKNICEITSIWNVTLANRNKALSLGITSWKDSRCNSDVLGITNKHKATIIDSILNINRQDEDKILPKKIINNVSNWKQPENEMFVDFETLIDFNYTDNKIIIFMIGVYWKNNNKWQYKSFTCNNISSEEEYRIINDFVDFLIINKHPKLWYWYADNKIWNSAVNRHLDKYNKDDNKEKQEHICNTWNTLKWLDMSKIFNIEPVVIKDCFDFSLKNITKALNSHNLIKYKLKSECNNGMSASIIALDVYKNSTNPLSNKVFKDLEKYNKFDVKILYKIIDYLRINHI